MGTYTNNESRTWAMSALSYFKEEVTTWLDSTPENITVRANALEEALTEHLQIAVIDLDEDEKPHVIFETLNARGEQLRQSDLVKNTVMYETDVTDNAEKASQLWGPFNDEWWQGDTSETSKRTHIDRFLNYWLMMRVLRNVSPDRVASEFRKYVEERSDGSRESFTKIAAKEICDAAKIYKALEEAKLPEIKIFLTRIKTLGLGVVTPLLLWLYTSNKVPSEWGRRSIEVLESYVVRRMFCGLPTRGLGNLFIGLLQKLEKRDPAHATSTIIDYLRDQTADSRVWPNDRLLREHLTERPMAGTAARRKMILVAVEMSLQSDKSEPIGATDKLTVEHIMPQNWERNWPLPPSVSDEAEAKEIRTEAIKTIGNLTLTTNKLNAGLSNGPWCEKRETLDLHSRLFLNKKLLETAPNVWDEAAIDERSRCLADIILRIWPDAEKFTEKSA